MKGKKLLCIVLSLAAVCSLLLMRDSVAWFNTSTGTPPTGTIRVDKMAFSFNGSLDTYLKYTISDPTYSGQKYTVTEQNLIVGNGGKITVTNYSTVATEARFKITYDTPDTAHPGETLSNTYTASATDALAVTVGSQWLQKDNDGYFYYYRTLPDAEGQTAEEIAGTEGFAPVAASATTFTPVDAITDIEFKDSVYVTNNGVTTDILEHDDYFPSVNGTVTPFLGEVHVVFEAKQADNVNWTQITAWPSSATPGATQTP